MDLSLNVNRLFQRMRTLSLNKDTEMIVFYVCPVYVIKRFSVDFIQPILISSFQIVQYLSLGREEK